MENSKIIANGKIVMYQLTDFFNLIHYNTI